MQIEFFQINSPLVSEDRLNYVLVPFEAVGKPCSGQQKEHFGWGWDMLHKQVREVFGIVEIATVRNIKHQNTLVPSKNYQMQYGNVEDMQREREYTLTWVPSRPANGESFTPKVMEMVGGSSSTVGKAVMTCQIPSNVNYKCFHENEENMHH